MCLNTKKIKRAFNKAAIYYDDTTPVQQQMGKKLIASLPKKSFAHVIDLGCGTGFTTKNLARSIKFSRFEAIDLSESMIRQATDSPLLNEMNNIQFKIQAFDDLLPESYELVFSNMALHWSSNFSHTLQIIQRALKSKGLLAFSIPLLETFQELKPYFNIHHFNSSQEILDKLKPYFSIKNVATFRKLLTFEDTLSALRSIKKTGATVCKTFNFSYKNGRQAIRYNHIQQLTYHIGLFIVEKP